MSSLQDIVLGHAHFYSGSKATHISITSLESTPTKLFIDNLKACNASYASLWAGLLTDCAGAVKQSILSLVDLCMVHETSVLA